MLIARLLKTALQPLVRTGPLSFVLVGGQRIDLGDGSGPPVVVRFTDARVPWALLLDPDLRTGELYTDGRMVIDQGSIYEMLHIVLGHGDQTPPPWPSALIDRVRHGLRKLGPTNDRRRSRRNVSHHYDLGDRPLPRKSCDGPNVAGAVVQRPLADIEATSAHSPVSPFPSSCRSPIWRITRDAPKAD